MLCVVNSSAPSTALMVAAALAAGAFIACAPPRTLSATVTAADVSDPVTKESSAVTPADTSDGVVKAAATSDNPTGQLACRTKTPVDGTIELFLEWKGTDGKGVLRRVANSGELYLKKVRAERAKTLIVVDDLAATTVDLTAHTAIVGEQSGKRYIRLGEWKDQWSACE